MAACDVMYLRALLEHMGLAQTGATRLLIDNKGVTDIARDPVSTTALKHVKRRHFFVREVQQAGEIIAVPVGSNQNIADIFTKETKPVRFGELCKRLYNRTLQRVDLALRK